MKMFLPDVNIWVTKSPAAVALPPRRQSSPVREGLLHGLLLLLLYLGFSLNAGARDLVAGVGNIPPHAVLDENGQASGGFVEVVRAIDRVYTGGEISIRVLPLKRSVLKLSQGEIDFHIPYILNPEIPADSLSYGYASEPVVDVAFVLYTRADSEISPTDDLGQFNIETLRGAESHFPFRISGIDSFEQGILRVSLGRSDGFIAEQDASDIAVRQNRIKNIRRALYASWKSSIPIRKGPDSEEIDRIVSGSLRSLKQQGILQKITDTIHRPYDDWQPYLTDWSTQ